VAYIQRTYGDKAMFEALVGEILKGEVPKRAGFVQERLGRV